MNSAGTVVQADDALASIIRRQAVAVRRSADVKNSAHVRWPDPQSPSGVIGKKRAARVRNLRAGAGQKWRGGFSPSSCRVTLLIHTRQALLCMLPSMQIKACCAARCRFIARAASASGAWAAGGAQQSDGRFPARL